MSILSKLKTLHLVTLSPTARFIKYAKPGHYYSPIPAYEDVGGGVAREHAFTGNEPAGVDLAVADQLEFVRWAGQRFGLNNFPIPNQALSRFREENIYFAGADAAILVAMIERSRPKRIIEVGSGFSSALMLDAIEHLKLTGCELQFIEPYPERLISLVGPNPQGAVSICQQKVQDVPLTEFDKLEPNDILFIDSSHVSKVGSDVNFLFFHVLPRLKNGVLIHIHDVQWPFEYPQAWFDEGRVWNEAYLVRALLMFSQGFKIECFNSWLQTPAAAAVERSWPLVRKGQAASIWLRKVI